MTQEAQKLQYASHHKSRLQRERRHERKEEEIEDSPQIQM